MRAVIWLTSEVCDRDWSSYPGNSLWAGDGKALLRQRWAERPKMLGSVQVSAQVFELYLLWLINWHHSTDFQRALLVSPGSGPLGFFKLGYKS